MDETLRLCHEVQQNIADVDLRGEAESDLDKIDVSSVEGYSRIHHGVGSPKSESEVDDQTFKDQVDQLVRRASYHIEGEENEVVNVTAKPLVSFREPSTIIRLVHCKSTELKTLPSYNHDDRHLEDSPDYSYSENAYSTTSESRNMDFSSKKKNV